MGNRGFGFVLVLAFELPACAQGDLDGATTFGPFEGSAPADNGDDGSGPDDGSGDGTVGGSGGDATGGGPTGGPADTSGAGSTEGIDESSGAPVTASTDGSSGPGPASSSEGGGETSSGAASSSGGAMDDGAAPGEEWGSCTLQACPVATLCTEVTGLRAYSPYCAPECVVDADCSDPGGTAPVLCALVEMGAVDPTHCAIVCELNNIVQGNCPAGMTCAEVPNQMTQVALCMWP